MKTLIILSMIAVVQISNAQILPKDASMQENQSAVKGVPNHQVEETATQVLNSCSSPATDGNLVKCIGKEVSKNEEKLPPSAQFKVLLVAFRNIGIQAAAANGTRMLPLGFTPTPKATK